MKLRHLALSCLCAAALLSGRAEAKCELIRSYTLHVVVDGNQILIPGRLGGGDVKFLFDTSFPASVVMPAAAKRMGLELLDYMTAQSPSGAINSRVTGGVSFAGHASTESAGGAIASEFNLDGHTVHHTLFAMFGTRDSFGAPDVAAVLGSDFWNQYDVEIDAAHGTIDLLQAKGCEDSNLAYWTPDYNVVDTRTSNNQARFNTELNGQRLVTILDSGSPFSSLTRRAAISAGPPLGQEVDADVWHPGQQPTDLLSLTKLTYGLGTHVGPSAAISSEGTADTPFEDVLGRTTVANFGSFKVDEEVIKPARFRIVPTPKAKPETGSRLGQTYFDYDAVLGVDFLLAHHVLIANSQHKIYFSYTGGPALQSVSAVSVPKSP